jgi:hypothetical protein
MTDGQYSDVRLSVEDSDGGGAAAASVKPAVLAQATGGKRAPPPPPGRVTTVSRDDSDEESDQAANSDSANQLDRRRRQQQSATVETKTITKKKVIFLFLCLNVLVAGSAFTKKADPDSYLTNGIDHNFYFAKKAFQLHMLNRIFYIPKVVPKFKTLPAFAIPRVGTYQLKLGMRIH